MRGKLKGRHDGGFTLTEVLAAMVLIAVVLIPIVKALVHAQTSGEMSRRVTEALILAERRMEDIRATALEAYGTDFTSSSEPISGRFLCTTTDGGESLIIKSIRVQVGFDDDGNGVLAQSEVDAILDTKIANRQ
jgi:prepilin-type N-terminal cleavage/methylation domain-containing protein